MIRVYLLGWLVPGVTLIGVPALQQVEFVLDLTTGEISGAMERVE